MKWVVFMLPKGVQDLLYAMSPARFFYIWWLNVQGMNWKLIIMLSVCGIVMGFAAVAGLPSKAEPFAWLPLFLLSAWFIARNADRKHFLHGFLTGVANTVWNTVIHVKFAERYLAKHPVEAAQFMKMHAQSGATITQSILITSIVSGLISAVVLGVFASMGAGFLKKIA